MQKRVQCNDDGRGVRAGPIAGAALRSMAGHLQTLDALNHSPGANMKRAAKKKNRSIAPRYRSSNEKPEVNNQHWRSALIEGETHTHNVSLRALNTSLGTANG